MQQTNASAPSFILSHIRTGSTLLRYIIDTHPELCSPGELYIGRLCSLFTQTVEMTLGAVTDTADPFERQRLVRAKVREIIDDLMDTYARGKGKRMWCEKTPKNVDFLHALVNIYPDAKYICLYRHCLDVVQSCLEAAQLGLTAELPFYARNENNHVAVFVDSWVEKTTKMLALERRLGAQCLRVKYESLVLNPAATLRPMFEFLGVAWDDALVEKVFTTPHDRGRAPGDEKVLLSREIHSKSLGRGARVNREMIPPHLTERMNALLAELDYPAAGPGWERALTRSVEPAPAKSREVVANAEEFFNARLPALLERRGEHLRGIGASFKFVVTGTGGGTWLLDLSKAGGQISAGDAPTTCVINVSSDDLLRVVNGELNPAEALQQGRMHISGDAALAAQMAQALLV
ncbi:MAG TPA: sulfotransferase [Pyrinomonadaceae bacterium]|nr:sulfotransferase [Pyrinomonadaceae bacterium]